MPIHAILERIRMEIRSAWRFRWYGALAAWLLSIAGLVWICYQPDVYQANARVYVDTSSVLRPLLNNRIVPPDIGTMLVYVRQAMLGREKLERIASDNGLDSEVTTPAELDRVLMDLRDGIGFSLGNSANSVFTISYRDSERERAVNVVGTLLDSLVEDMLVSNRAGSETAEEFVNERISEYEARLQEAEEARADFRKRNATRLPGSQGGYFERMRTEQEALEVAQRNLRLAQSRRDELLSQLNNASSSEFEGDLPATSIDARIRNRQAELDNLLIEFTDRHPDVVAVREALERLEEQRDRQLEELGRFADDRLFSTLDSNPIYQALRISLNETEVEVASLEADVGERARSLEQLSELIDELPRIEAELARLNRDYDVIYEQYQGLVRSRETQDLSQKAYDTDSVEFRVIDPPAADERPVAPRRTEMLVALLVAALGAGAGLSWLLAQVRPVFATVASLREICGLPVLGVVSTAWASRRRLRRRITGLVFVGAVAALVGLFAVAVVLEVSGPGLHELVRLVPR